MDRKLASVQIISDIQPIPDADKIQVASVLGWKSVIRKDEYKINDKVVYVECDSILPFEPWSQFLQDKNNPSKPIRIKTVKLRKQISQGIILPLSILPEGNYEIDQEVTELLNVVKYEPQLPAQLSGTAKGNFYPHARKSDENRLQSLRSSIYDEFHGKECYVSLKYDGTSGTFYRHGDRTGVCSRNLELKEPEEGQSIPVYWEMNHKYNILNELKELDVSYQIIGECYGNGIQGNKLNISGHDLAVFTLFNIDKQEYCGYRELKEVCEKLELPMVKVLDVFTFDKNIHTLDYWLNFAKGNYDKTNNPREGVVVRSIIPFYSETLHGFSSFKIINNDFLLKEE